MHQIKQSCGHAWVVIITDDCYRMVQPTLGSAIPGRCAWDVSEIELVSQPESKSVSSLLPGFCSRFLIWAPVLTSLSNGPLLGSISWINLFFPRLFLFRMLYYGNRKETRMKGLGRARKIPQEPGAGKNGRGWSSWREQGTAQVSWRGHICGVTFWSAGSGKPLTWIQVTGVGRKQALQTASARSAGSQHRGGEQDLGCWVRQGIPGVLHIHKPIEAPILLSPLPPFLCLSVSLLHFDTINLEHTTTSNIFLLRSIFFPQNLIITPGLCRPWNLLIDNKSWGGLSRDLVWLRWDGYKLLASANRYACHESLQPDTEDDFFCFQI